MAKNTCDGDIYIRNLSSFIKSHERQLANALVAYKKLNSKDQSKLTSKSSSTTNTNTTTTTTNNNTTGSTTTLSTTPPSTTKATTNNTEINPSKENDDNETIEKNKNLKSSKDQSILKSSTSTTDDDEEILTKEISKPVRLSLSLHHLYFILGKFQELGINVGPMNLRLDNIDSDNNNNYVSFLSEFQRNKKLDSDTQSIHSMSSVKSVMSSVSALWNTFNSGSKADNAILELKYLYSAFSKLPCLRLANEPNAKLIEGHEEYPFETATPIIIFKNLLVLEISDLDPKEIYGWNLLSNKLRYLVVKKANISDPIEILINLVEADSIVRGEDDDFIDTNINDDFSINNPSSSIMKQNDSNQSSNYNYDDYLDDEKLTKTTSHNSDLNPLSDSIDRSLYRSSTLSSSIPLTHTSINLVSSLSTSNINSLSNSTSKNHHSPTLYQPSSFSPSQQIHTSYTPHTLTPLPHHNYYYHNNNNNNNNNNNQNSSSTENIVNFSTSPTTSTFSSNYHPNRLYAEDILASSTNKPNSLTSRRSYFYKPPKKSRRSRGSSSMIISNSTNGASLLGSTNLEPIVDSKSDNNLKKTDENLKKSINRLSGANASRKSIDSHNSLDLSNTNNNSNNNNNNSQSYWKLLKHLSLTDNKIEKISSNSFDNLCNLTLLDLSYNKLTKLPSEPLSKLVNLKTLNLSFNKLLTLEKFPKSLTKLTILNLRGNKISDLDSIENLSQLQKIDLRQNKLSKITNLKPLLLLNKDIVRLTSVQLLGNPIAKSRGYRIELFNLFNGVDYTNNVRIDGSRPGIFESRMLLDEKTSKMRFNNFMDESIISKMTASVSNMNLSNIINHSSVTSITTNKNMSSNSTLSKNNSHTAFSSQREGCLSPPIEFKNPDTTDKIIKPVLDHMTTSITLLSSDNNNNLSINRSSVSSIKNLELLIDKQRQHKQPSINDSSSVNSFKPPSIPPATEAPRLSPSPSLMSIRNPVAVSFVNSNSNTTTTSINSNSNPTSNHQNPIEVNNASAVTGTTTTVSEFSTPLPRSVSHSQRTSNDYSSTTSSIITTNTGTANVDNNPIARLSLASPALPVITQATTTTMTITGASNPTMDLRQSGLPTPTELSPAALSRSEYLVKPSNTTNNSTAALSSLKNHDDTAATATVVVAAAAADDNKENKSNDSKLSNEDFGSGLKISVI